MSERSHPGTDRPAGIDRDARQQELRDIFVATTGTEEFTETQQQQTSSRTIAAEDSIARTVTDIAKADGLTDTYTDLEYNDEGR